MIINETNKQMIRAKEARFISIHLRNTNGVSLGLDARSGIVGVGEETVSFTPTKKTIGRMFRGGVLPQRLRADKGRSFLNKHW